MNFKQAKQIVAHKSEYCDKPDVLSHHQDFSIAKGFLEAHERAEKVIKAAQKVLDESWVHSEASAMEGLDSAVKEWRRENGGENV